MADTFSRLNFSINIFYGRLGIIATVIILIGLLMLFILLLDFFASLRNGRGINGFFRKVFVLFISLLFISSGSAILTTAMYLQAYRAFTAKTLVGLVEAKKAMAADYNIILKFTPVNKGAKGEARIYNIKGDQWSIGGDILKFDDWLNLIGVSTGYKTTRIHGRYLAAADENIKGHTAYDINGGTDEVWLFLYNNSSRIPFVKAIYGNSAYAFSSDEFTYEVYVATTGYFIEKIDKSS